LPSIITDTERSKRDSAVVHKRTELALDVRKEGAGIGYTDLETATLAVVIAPIGVNVSVPVEPVTPPIEMTVPTAVACAFVAVDSLGILLCCF